jgi:hypothetical protein
MEEIGKFWKIIFASLEGSVSRSYFEAALQCDTEGVSTKKFLSDLVNVKLAGDNMQKGFSLTLKSDHVTARISVDISDPVPDGLYVLFAYVTDEPVETMPSFHKLFDETLAAYHHLQGLAQIKLLEPK